MTFTKAHIVENLFAKNLFTKGESAQIIERLFELIKQSLEKVTMFSSVASGSFPFGKNTSEQDGTPRLVSRWPYLLAPLSRSTTQRF